MADAGVIGVDGRDRLGSDEARQDEVRKRLAREARTPKGGEIQGRLRRRSPYPASRRNSPTTDNIGRPGRGALKDRAAT